MFRHLLHRLEAVRNFIVRHDLRHAVDLLEHLLGLRDEAVVLQCHDEPVAQGVGLNAREELRVILRGDKFIERLLAGDKLCLVYV